MPQIEVDFNSRDALGYIPGLAANANGPLLPGEPVEVFDLAGFHCQATVVGIASGVLALDPIWATFVEPGATRLRLDPAPGRSFSWSSPLSVTVIRVGARVAALGQQRRDFRVPITSGAA
jgi:hypothetical protein